nr:hypothetical protein [Cronobacter universalis]
MSEALSASALATLFTDARTHSAWRETPVSVPLYKIKSRITSR